MINSRAKGAAGIEIWRPVKDYDGLYEVSNIGRIRSLPRNTTKGKILKTYISKRNSYVYVSLCKNNKKNTLRLHRLIMQAFYPQSDITLQVNHIDGDKTNNMLENLEWCNQSENMKHAYHNGLEKKRGIKVIDIDTKEIFETATDAAKSVGNGRGGNVIRVCRGEISHYKNRHYAFYDDYINDTIPKYSGKNTRKASVTLWR